MFSLRLATNRVETNSFRAVHDRMKKDFDLDLESPITKVIKMIRNIQDKCGKLLSRQKMPLNPR